MRTMRLILALLGLLLLAACRNASSAGNASHPQSTATFLFPSPTSAPSTTPTPTEIPHLILGAPPELAEAASTAIAGFPADGSEWVIQLNPSQPDQMQLENGQIDLALLPDDAGGKRE